MNIIRLTTVLCAALISVGVTGNAGTPVPKIGPHFILDGAVTYDSPILHDTGAVSKGQWMLFANPHIHIKNFPPTGPGAPTEQFAQATESTDASKSKSDDAAKSAQAPRKTPLPFSEIVTPFSSSIVKDITIIYDAFVDRWFVYGKQFKTDNSGPDDLIIAISAGDPITQTTRWHVHTISADDILSNRIDDHLYHQQLAFDHYNIYACVANFDAQGNYTDASMVVINKPSLLANLPASITKLIPPSRNEQKDNSCLCPVTNFDQNPQFGYFISTELTDQSTTTETSLALYRVINPQTLSPKLNVPIALPGSRFFHSSGLVPGKDKPDLFVGHVMAHVRNKHLFLSHTVLVDKTGKSSLQADRYGIRICQFDLTGKKEEGQEEKDKVEKLDTVPLLINEIIVYDKDPHTQTPKHFWNGTVMSNKNGDLVVSALVAGQDQFPAAVVAGRLYGDAANTIRPPLLLTYHACGDVSALVLDQNNGVNFWSINQFIKDDQSVGIKVTSLVPV